MKLKIDLASDNPNRNYFKSVSDRLQAMRVSRGALARELDMDGAQLNRYFTTDDPNPTFKMLIRIEKALVTLRHRKA